VAGIGNIYADETLFRAGIRPDRPTDSLTQAEWRSLARCLRRVLQLAVARRGSSLRDYRDGVGRSGSFQRLHRVYGRAGQPCVACATTLHDGRVAGRTTAWCPTCQA
jgi:formamidopyrimidine-DNA glycosylase